MKASRLFAFWKYDSFPYFLGGPFEEMNSKGAVRPLNYGGYWFNPVKIYPEETGLELSNKLKQLDEERRQAIKDLEMAYKVKLGLLLGQYNWSVNENS